jgi:hypothetical protein
MSNAVLVIGELGLGQRLCMVRSDCTRSNDDCGWTMTRIMWMVVEVRYIVVYARRAEQSSTMCSMG